MGAPPEECRRIFDAYGEAGGNVIDTANGHTDGAREKIVGELLTGDMANHPATTPSSAPASSRSSSTTSQLQVGAQVDGRNQ